ncbi:MAG: hypothetical protein AAFU64_01040 [Bacteroidota bacterium]
MIASRRRARKPTAGSNKRSPPKLLFYRCLPLDDNPEFTLILNSFKEILSIRTDNAPVNSNLDEADSSLPRLIMYENQDAMINKVLIGISQLKANSGLKNG